MRRLSWKALVLAAVVGLLVLSVAGVASAAFPQQWFLDSDAHPAGLSGAKVMVQNSSASANGSVLIADGASQIWCANNPTLADLTFPTGPECGSGWRIQFKLANTDQPWGGTGQGIVQIGEWDVAAQQFNPFITTVYDAELTSQVWVILTQTQPGTVHANNYLALRINNTDVNDHNILGCADSYVMSPCCDPGYPIPEIAAGILLGLGLIALAAFVYLRRKRAKSAAKA